MRILFFVALEKERKNDLETRFEDIKKKIYENRKKTCWKRFMKNEEDIDDINIRVIEIDKWETPVTHYPEIEFGSARIRRGKYEKGLYHNYGVMGYEYFLIDKPIDITSLEIMGEDGIWNTWMVDDIPHFWSMQLYATNSYGKVLVAGLGLGMIVGELLKNVDVDSITVVEINKDVIDLISPLLSLIECDSECGYDNRLKIINEDFYKFINETNEKFDRIIIDLWVSGSEEETEKLLNEKIVPLSYYIRKLFPDASVVFHGFGISW